MAEMDVTAYIERGIEHFIKEDSDRAIVDFNSAWALVFYQIERKLCCQSKGE